MSETNYGMSPVQLKPHDPAIDDIVHLHKLKLACAHVLTPLAHNDKFNAKVDWPPGLAGRAVSHSNVVAFALSTLVVQAPPAATVAEGSSRQAEFFLVILMNDVSTADESSEHNNH